MPCILIPGGIMTLGGPEYVIDVGGKDIRFEHHHYSGPCPMNKKGDFITLSGRHKFWQVVTYWAKQGYRVENGRAIYDPPPTTRWVMIDKRNAVDEETAKRLGVTGKVIDVPDY